MNSDPKLASKRFSLARWMVAATAGATVLVAVACGSDNDPGAGPGPDAAAETGPTPPPGIIDAGAGEARAPIECAPPAGYDDCTGKCGPLRNPCTGAIEKQCGGCTGTNDAGDALVCELETNTCIKPKRTCEDFGAECGRLRNSCGEYIDCPTGNANIECPAGDADGGLVGQECDPDTHKCRTATSVTCADLGYQCGQAWLGVGPKTNLTNCGDCSAFPDRPRCNTGLIPLYNVCEPACTPPSTPAERLAACRAAKETSGIECGIITDGCGGAIDCTIEFAEFKCPAGETCGDRGVANRCDKKEPPVECVAAGRNCGTIQSVCTGGTVSCGECTGTDVCNENGVCGPPCVPKKCADLGSPECLPTQTPVPDGCGGSVTDCPTCPGGGSCRPTGDADAGVVGGTCCTPTYSCTNRPPGFPADACGAERKFDNGCGVMIDCTCPGGTCIDGTCCTPSACPAPSAVNGACGTTDRGCGLSCVRGCVDDANGNDNVCRNGTCCNPEPDNNTEWRQQNPGRCAFNIPNGCGGTIDAPCTGNGVCINVASGPGNVITDPSDGSPSAIGYCCTNPTASCDTTNTCETIASACVVGQTVNCGHAQCADGADGQNDEVCYDPPGAPPPACCDPLSCPGAVPAGQACGNAAFDRGCGLTCNTTCAPDANNNPNSCVNGQCCNPEPDNATEWRDGQPAGACAFNIPNGCGGFIDAGCASGSICVDNGVQVPNSGTTFAEGTCCRSADSCGGPIAENQPCVVDNICLSGNQTVTCPCAGGNTCYQGTCCRAQACPSPSPLGGACGNFDRGCGQSCNRGCAQGSCYQGTCCQPLDCPSAAPIGGTCGTFNRNCGQTCNVGCDRSGNKNNNTCVNGTCECEETPCPPGFTGSMQSGCGGIKACTGS